MRILQINTDKRRLGTLGERAAARFLRKSRYRIIERNYCSDEHEIDFIAEDKEYLVFVEVKTRTLGHESAREPRPAAAVTPEKQRSVISAAKQYIAFHPTDKKKRFDVIEVYVNDINSRKNVAEIKHLVGAFNLNSAYKSSYR